MPPSLGQRLTQPPAPAAPAELNRSWPLDVRHTVRSAARSHTRGTACTWSAPNYTAPKHPALRHRLAKHPRIQLRFSLTSGSWVTKSKTSPGSSSPDKGSRGTFTSVEDLVAAIGTFIDGWNERCQPAVWTNPGTARDGDPGQDERQAGHRQTDPLLRRARSRSRPGHDAHRGHGSRTWRVTRTHQNLIGY